MPPSLKTNDLRVGWLAHCKIDIPIGGEFVSSHRWMRNWLLTRSEAVIDASGDVSEMANRTTLARLVQGGVIPVTTNVVLSEVHRTWNRPEAAEIGKLYGYVSPHYHAVMESYVKAQEVAGQSK